MLRDFYISFSAVCFTLLGLWLVVVQTRHAEWRGSALARRRAYGVALHFSLPGLMSLLALVNPDSSALWRTSFAIVAIGGAAVLIAVRGPAVGKLGLGAYIFAIALYTLIGILAIAPRIVGGLGLDATPVRVEAVLLTILVFTGVNVGTGNYSFPPDADEPNGSGGVCGACINTGDNRIEGRVGIHPTAELRSSVIVGPSIIGPGARISNSLVGPYTSIGARAELEGAEVERSIVAEGARIMHVGRRIEGSTIGQRASIFRDFALPRGIRLQVGANAEMAFS